VYQEAADRLVELRGSRLLFDPDRTILEKNLYGVDLNEEAIQICRLSIWIKTAQRGKKLTDVDRTIRGGNSLVEDSELDPRNAFDWKTTFPEVAGGGFDAVVGNPPYVRQELGRLMMERRRRTPSPVRFRPCIGTWRNGEIR
jgi:type I restriction-modification system DNA methylase subunit